MTLQELLTELQRNILHDRSDAVPGSDQDQLWDQPSLIRYINQAQDKFARETECLRDATTPDCCQIQTVVGQQYYPLHRKVIGVMSAQNTGDNTDLARAGHANLSTYHVPDERFFFNPQNLSQLPPGKPLAFTTDEGFMNNDRGSMSVMTLRIYPVVGAGFASIVNMRVVRLPLRHFTADDMDAEPEIPESYHLDLLDWAAYLAIRYTDLDVAGVDQLVRMRDFKARFDETVQKVQQQLKRKVFAPMQWGFGRNGFSYTSDWNV